MSNSLSSQVHVLPYVLDLVQLYSYSCTAVLVLVGSGETLSSHFFDFWIGDRPGVMRSLPVIARSLSLHEATLDHNFKSGDLLRRGREWLIIVRESPPFVPRKRLEEI